MTTDCPRQTRRYGQAHIFKILGEQYCFSLKWHQFRKEKDNEELS